MAVVSEQTPRRVLNRIPWHVGISHLTKCFLASLALLIHAFVRGALLAYQLGVVQRSASIFLEAVPIIVLAGFLIGRAIWQAQQSGNRR